MMMELSMMILLRKNWNENIDNIWVADESLPEKNDDDATVNCDIFQNNENGIIDDVGISDEYIPH